MPQMTGLETSWRSMALAPLQCDPTFHLHAEQTLRLDKRLVKRVVGLPGDSVAVVDGMLVVNDEAVRYSPLQPGMVTGLELDEQLPILATEELGDTHHAVMITPRSPWHTSFKPFTVPAEKYFVMGDNRDHSLDSRHFGPVDRDQIVGRATTVAASVNPERRFLPRWRRFLKDLQ